METDLVRVLGIHAGTFAVCALAGLVPLVNTEVFLLLLSVTLAPASVPGVVAAAVAGQMSAKSLLYFSGRRAIGAPVRPELGRWVEKLRARGGTADGIVLASAVSGFPPFYAVSIGAGVLRWNFARFLVAGTCGRLIRFGALTAAPSLARELWS